MCCIWHSIAESSIKYITRGSAGVLAQKYAVAYGKLDVEVETRKSVCRYQKKFIIISHDSDPPSVSLFRSERSRYICQTVLVDYQWYYKMARE